MFNFRDEKPTSNTVSGMEKRMYEKKCMHGTLGRFRNAVTSGEKDVSFCV